MNPVVCPGCGSDDIKSLGRVPRSDSFAGRAVPMSQARLMVCRTCDLGFKSPQPSPERLAELYAAGTDSAWTTEEMERPDWTAAARMIAALDASTVLDVGCFDGAFLDQLAEPIAKFGIEINPEAADQARAHGVEIIAADLNHLPDIKRRFDVVVAFDVIEHVHSPSEFLSTLRSAVAPGGHVIVATGNFRALTQRFMRSRYLYSWYQEHIAFVSPRWMRRHAPGLGLEVVDVVRFSHHPQGLSGLLTGFAKNALYRIAPSLFVRIRATRAQPADQGGTAASPPAWASAPDHFVVLLRASGRPD